MLRTKPECFLVGSFPSYTSLQASQGLRCPVAPRKFSWICSACEGPESFARHRRWWGVAGIGTGRPVLGDSSWAVKRVPTKAPVPTAGTQFLEAKAEGATGPDLGLAYLPPRGSRGSPAGLSTGTAGSMGPWPPPGSGTPLPEEKAGLKGVGLEGGRLLPGPMSPCWAPPCWLWEEGCLSLGHNRVSRALPIILLSFSHFLFSSQIRV